MATRALPDNPSLEHLRNQAKALQRRARAGDADALATVRDHHPRLAGASDAALGGLGRADAQLTVARLYGFASWPRLRRHLDVVARYARSPHRQPVGRPARDRSELADELLRLATLNYGVDDPERWASARQLLAQQPELARASIHTMASVGDVEAARELLAADPAQARSEGGPFRWEPLLYAAYSRLDSPRPEHSTYEVARLLLAHGADPNAGYLWEGLTSPFTALTGAFGGGEGNQPPHRQEGELARLLLEAGADPNDNQALYNRMFRADDSHLELLFAYGLGRGDGGPWHARLGPTHPTPTQMLGELLRFAANDGYAERVRLLLEHGVDPEPPGPGHPLLEGRAPYELAVRGGHVETARLLAEAGARVPPLDPVEQLVVAAMAADRPAVERLLVGQPELAATAVAREPELIRRAAGHGRVEAVRLLAELGFDVNAGRRTTPLHEAAWRGDRATTELLLALGADPLVHDRDHDATPRGWAEHAGHDDLASLLHRHEVASSP